MKIAIRVDASLKIGTGHVMRCRTLALGLQRDGLNVHFIIREHEGHLGDMLLSDGFEVTLLPSPKVEIISADIYQGWLGVRQEDDADQTIQALSGGHYDWLVVDHYGLNYVWESQLKPHAKKIMVIDDLENRRHNCDVLLDQNYGIEKKSVYQQLVPDHCLLLLGPRYALLHPKYRSYREVMEPRNGNIKQVLVFMGGADPDNITGMVIAALSTKKLEYLKLDVVIGSNFIHRDLVNSQVKARPNTSIYGPRPHLADLMSRADFAIGAGGATTWERLCLNLPSLVISIAENQNKICEALQEAGLIRYIGQSSDINSSKIEAAIFDSISELNELRDSKMTAEYLVDGLGLSRVIEVLNPADTKQLRLRRANSNDYPSYHFWGKDSVVLSNAICGDSLDLSISLASFVKALRNLNLHFYVLEIGDLVVGHVFFDDHGGRAEIDYAVDDFSQKYMWKNHMLMRGIQAFNRSKSNSFKRLDVKRGRNTKVGATFIRSNYPHPTRESYSIVIVSDKDSWLNIWIPKLIRRWLNDGHELIWTHRLSEIQPADFCFYLSFSTIVQKDIRAMFKNNLVVHESDLPTGKGWSPLTWKILEGGNVVPVSLIEADEKVDSGVIYGQLSMNFDGYELVEELRYAQADATFILCEKFINEYPEILKNATLQTGVESFYRKRIPSDSKLDVNDSIADQFNLLRVVDNEKYPAFFELSGYSYKLEINKIPS